jgi:hypothetical protein
VKDKEWLALDDTALERLLVERWLLRGVLLAVMLAAAIGTTYMGTRGVTTLPGQLSVGALLVMAILAGAAAFVMRLTDIRIHKELRRRRREGAGPIKDCGRGPGPGAQARP